MLSANDEDVKLKERCGRIRILQRKKCKMDWADFSTSNAANSSPIIAKLINFRESKKYVNKGQRVGLKGGQKGQYTICMYGTTTTYYTMVIYCPPERI